ncbi:MAG: hypothetical protein IKG39_01695 [Lachnospiraceae bacterium]|nr:hypothetical protein [Lachnospiraceae bacterium]
MNENDIKKAIHQADLTIRPKIMFLHPEDKKQITEQMPDIEKKIVIEESAFIDRGQGIIMDRKELEQWRLGPEEISE